MRKWLDEAMVRFIEKRVLVIDEAPLLDGDSLVKLLKLAKKLECKVILQGDLAQQHSVGAVDGVRLLRQELGLGTEIERLSVTRRNLMRQTRLLLWIGLKSGCRKRWQK